MITLIDLLSTLSLKEQIELRNQLNDIILAKLNSDELDEDVRDNIHDAFKIIEKDEKELIDLKAFEEGPWNEDEIILNEENTDREIEKDWNLYPNNEAGAFDHLDDNINHELETENNMLLAKRDSDFRSFQNPMLDDEYWEQSQ